MDTIRSKTLELEIMAVRGPTMGPYVKHLKHLKRKYFITNFNAFEIILYYLNNK